MKKTAVEWLAEKLEYVNWMRNRDEISAGMADEWRKHYLEQAKTMEKEQIEEAWYDGCSNGATICSQRSDLPAEQYYNETFNK